MKLIKGLIGSLGVGILAGCLFPLYFYQKNYPQIVGQDIAIIIGVFAIIHILVWTILGFIFRDRDRTCLVAYTFWGTFWFSRPILSFIRCSCAWTQALYDLVFTYRYAVVLGVFIPTILVAYLWIRKHPAITKTTVKILNVAMVLELLLLVWQTTCKVHQYAQLERYTQEHPVAPDGDYPNIYHILLDAHPNLEGARLLGYDLQPFYDELNKLGFITFPHSRSNYWATCWSVSSMLSMDYLPGDESKLKDSTLHGFSKNNPVFTTLLNHGYQLQVFISHAIIAGLYPALYSNSIPSNPIDTFKQMTEYNSWLWTFIKLRYHFTSADHLTGLQRLLLPTTDQQPVYRYTHILCPHLPFVFTNDPSTTYGLSIHDQKVKSPEGINQLKRSNIAGIDAMVLPILKQLIQQQKKPIIILHSDHGFQQFPDSVDSLFGNLLALYIPDNWKSDATNLTFINLYRFILNHLFADHQPYIPQNRQIIKGTDFHPLHNPAPTWIE